MTDNHMIALLQESDKADQIEDNSNETTLDNGVVLVHNKIPPMIFDRLKETFKEPEVPYEMDEDKGRKILNPSNPTYIKAMEDYQHAFGTKMLDIFIAKGTKLKSVPANLQSPEDEDWAQELLDLGIVPMIADKGTARYLAWVKYYAAVDATDIARLAEKTKRLMGITEGEVAQSIATFPSEATRQADPRSEAKE